MLLSLRPYSLTRLTLASFLIVTLPLLLIIGAASLYVGRLGEQTEALVTHSVRLSRLGQEVEEKIAVMERNARQYQVLGDYSLVTLIGQRHAELTAILAELDSSHAGGIDSKQLDQMQEDSQAIINALNKEAPQSLELALALQRFDRLRKQTETIRLQSDQYVNQSSDKLRSTLLEAQRLLIILSATMIPLVVGLALFFTVKLTRPMQQIGGAIRNLGRRAFSHPISVSGPRELAQIGQQLESLRAHLTALEEEKNLFLRKMSHELKTPLASLREGSELLLDGTAGTLSPTQVEIAGILRTNSLELQILIENLLDYETWRDKSADLTISKFAFRPLVDAALQRHQQAIMTKRLKVETPFNDFDLQADRDRIRITLLNLVSNAVKFSPADGTITIRAQIEQPTDQGKPDDRTQRVTIEVADTGPGLLEEEHGKIFDSFFQGKIPPEGHLRGTGIGLSVVRDCIHAHGGSIEVIEGEYPGAHFRLRFASPPAAA